MDCVYCDLKNRLKPESQTATGFIQYGTKPDTMNNYMLVILILMIGGMVIMAAQGQWLAFYGMTAGAVIVIMYSSLRNRRKYKRKK